ncbi:unnamed protein product [Ilex paraguariensis]|uniref:Uncharacterized protein n=1 Tax=Ilex paraguariensis TaxID=185542 RepID=A0ABC8TDA5_9AQUA
MKRKKSCHDPPSSSSKKKCNHPSSMDPTVDPTSTNPTSFNPVDPTVNHPPSSSNPNPSSSNPICNEEISFFNKDCKQWYENYINYRTLLLERGVLLEQLKEVGCDVIFSLHQWNSTVDIKKTDKKKKIQQPQVEIENEVEVEDEDEAQAQDVPNSSTTGIPSTTQQPQPQVENEVEAEDDEAQT